MGKMEMEALKGNGYMRPASEGMTLIEIAVSLLIIGLMMAIAVPKFLKKPADNRRMFTADLNSILRSAVTGAQATNTFHRIKFDFKATQMVTLEKSSKSGMLKDFLSPRYEPVVPGGMLKTSCKIPVELIFKQFFIEKKDEIAGGGPTKEIWFPIDNNGNVQDVMIVLGEEDKEDVKTLTVNPFSKRFEVSDGPPKLA